MTTKTSLILLLLAIVAVGATAMLLATDRNEQLDDPLNSSSEITSGSRENNPENRVTANMGITGGEQNTENDSPDGISPVESDTVDNPDPNILPTGWEIYQNSTLEYHILYPVGWAVVEDSLFSNEGGLPLNEEALVFHTFRTILMDERTGSAITIRSSQAADGGTGLPPDSHVQRDSIRIGEKDLIKTIVRDSKGGVTTILVFNVLSENFNHWIEVNFNQSPTSAELEMIDRIMESLTIL